FSFIELADKFTSTSSVMPQKKNPDILELIRGKTAQVIGSQITVLTNLKGLPSGYSRDLQQIKVSIWPTSKIVISSLVVVNSLLKYKTPLQIKKLMQKNFTKSSSLRLPSHHFKAESLKDLLVNMNSKE